MQTAEIYYLDWEANPELATRLQFKDYTPTFDEFQQYWEQVGRDAVPDDEDDALRAIFAQWNTGSGRESEAFENADVREMSVGDVIYLHDTAHLVKPVGFEEIPF